MEVLDGQQLGGAVVHPPGAGGRLALGAVPVAAGVVRDALVPAVVARLDVAAQRGGAAGGDRTQDAPMFPAQLLAEPVGMTSHDLRQLQRRSLERRHHGVVVAWGACSRA